MTREYFSERAGRTQQGEISERLLRTAFAAAYGKFDRAGYFQDAFGKDCVEGFIPRKLGMSLRDHMAIRFGEGREDLYPSPEHIAEMSQDDIFDLIEYFHDNVGKPTKSGNHDWNGCGIHVQKADPQAGMTDWRNELNPTLARMKPPFRITEAGVIEYVPGAPGLQGLVDTPVASSDVNNIDARVGRAQAKFFARAATVDDQKEAIRELADVLEFIKRDLQAELTARDESDLFRIANGYAIRHHNAGQIQGYDRAVFYPWIFQIYLATIHLMVNIRTQRNAVVPPSET